MKKDKEATSSPLGRALRILECVLDASHPLTAAEIAQRCDLDNGTTHRLIQSLVAEACLIKDEESKRYVAAPKLAFPLPLYHPWNTLRRDVLPSLKDVRDRLRLTTGFVLFCYGQRILLELAPGPDPLSSDYRAALSSPLHASGSGKIFLMSQSPKERHRFLGPAPYPRFTDHTIVTERELDRHLAEAEAQGYVVSRDDYVMGFEVIAAPVKISGEPAIGCFFCSGRSSDFKDDASTHEAGCILRQAADLFVMTSLPLRAATELIRRS